MATAKKVTPKAAVNPKVKTLAKATTPAVKAAPKKAPVSNATKAIANISASIAKLTERKDKINVDINALRDQRAALKATAAAAPVAEKPKVIAKAAPKAAAPAKKAAKSTAKK